MNEIESFQHSNIAEEEMGQLHGIHYAENAVAAVRARLGSGQSLLNCAHCGALIPLQRRLAVQGCKTCVPCQTGLEFDQR